jgi:hypothetical protein
VARYFEAVEAAYNNNPYHNNTHAADVTQTAAVIMRFTHDFLAMATAPPQQQQQLQQQHRAVVGVAPALAPLPPTAEEEEEEDRGLSRLERFCVIFASAVHDLGHPGVNNDFLIRTRDKQAVIYNDKWVDSHGARDGGAREGRGYSCISWDWAAAVGGVEPTECWQAPAAIAP